MQRILVTGDCGLIGNALISQLRKEGHYADGYDIATNRSLDIMDVNYLYNAAASCTGIVHLAAMSRVIQGQRDPERCRLVNIQGTRNVLSAAAQVRGIKPWVIYASSREVYGQQETLPVPESAPLLPMNVYARCKAAAEQLVEESREQAGLRTSIVRFSNVYGSIHDHHDRVVPAFARAASAGGTLFVEGARTTLDLTHVDDVANGLIAMIDLMSAEGGAPTMHLVSGEGTGLLELATMAIEISGRGKLAITEPRTYDVIRFVGDPGLADHVLGWRAAIPLQTGLGQLISQFRQLADSRAGQRGEDRLCAVREQPGHSHKE